MKKYNIEKKVTIDGKRYTIRADSMEEFYVKKANKIRDVKEGKVMITGSMSVRQWTEQALAVYKSGVSDSVLKDMKSRIEKHIMTPIGDLPIKSIKPVQCQMILNAQAGMSFSHVSKLKHELDFIFRTAVQNKIILENPAADLVLPKNEKGKRRSVTDFERAHLLKVFDQFYPKFNLFELMLKTGCRPGEAIELEGRDIEVRDGKSLLHIRGTKTANADRWVPLPVDLYEKLKDKGPFEPLAPTEKGTKCSQTTYYRLADRLRRELNISMGCRVYRNQLVPPYPLSEDFVPYCLRHTYCTDLQKKGVDVRTAQYLMGHGTIAMTADIYTHVDDSQILNAANALGAALPKDLPDSSAANI